MICGDNHTIATLRSGDLEVASAINVGADLTDFAVDSGNHVVFAALRTSGGITLTMFDIVSGRALASTTMGFASRFASAEVEIDPGSKTLALVDSFSRLFGCTYSNTSLACHPVAMPWPVSEIAVRGDEALLANKYIATDHHMCIAAVSLRDGRGAPRYCAPATGVHFGVGIAAGKYVFGYTGVQKSQFMREEYKNVSSSVSVWSLEGGQDEVLAQMPQADPANFMVGARLACDPDAPRCLLYSDLANHAILYTIEP